MPACQHAWELTNIKYGFVVFEKCTHCNGLRTYFSHEDHPMIGDTYREDKCSWTCMENAQSIQFDLQCANCGHLEKFQDLMGFLYCTQCLPDCKVELLRKEYELKKSWAIVAFGFLPKNETRPFSPERLQILTDYFNQRRDTSRSTITVLSYDLIEDFSRCKGDFIHDVGMLSLQPQIRKTPF
ncbi:MAG: hypothetical protein P8184_18895 [Calditrichia bacterium]